jgi:hypothetical protein
MRTTIDIPAESPPLPLLRDPVPVQGIDLDDTSQLWELEGSSRMEQPILTP